MCQRPDACFSACNLWFKQPRSQGLSSSRPQERERLSLALGGVKKRDPGNEVVV